jgi:multidrug efflux pump subunit AcrA (membrane-fusion protein)
VGPWSHPIDLPSYDIMKVRTQAPESVVRRLRARRRVDRTGPGEGRSEPGSSARVWTKTLPGKVYRAEVIWIDGWGRDRNATLSAADIKSQGLSGVKVFNVEVELKESDPERLREGFRATVEFPIKTIPNVIAVPVHAVDFHAGVATVQVRVNGDSNRRIVRLGPESNGRVVIREGLREGEVIWVPPAPSSARGTENVEEGKGSGGDEGPAHGASPGVKRRSGLRKDGAGRPKRTGGRRRHRPSSGSRKRVGH